MIIKKSCIPTRMHVSSNRPVSEDEEEDDVFSQRSLYYGRAGGDVMGCRRPKLKIFQHARIISTMEFSSVCFSTVFCYKKNRSVIALAIYLFYIWLFIRDGSRFSNSQFNYRISIRLYTGCFEPCRSASEPQSPARLTVISPCRTQGWFV